MYIKRLETNHLSAIMALERASYPEELLEQDGLKDDLVRGNHYDYAYGGFCRGKLMCYIISYPLSKNMTIGKKFIFRI